MTKGIELSTKTIIIVLVAVLALTTVGIFMTRQFGSGPAIDYQTLWGKACTVLRFQNNCNVADFSLPDTNGNLIRFMTVCQKAVGMTDITLCTRQCGCSI